MFIRTFKNADLFRIVELEEICFVKGDGWNKDQYIEWLKEHKDTKIFYLIFDSEEENQLIAAAFAGINEGENNDEVHFIGNAVHPDYRRLGLGSLLITLRLVGAKLSGNKKVIAEVAADNEASLGALRKAGFRLNGVVLPKYYNNTIDALQLEKLLNKNK